MCVVFSNFILETDIFECKSPPQAPPRFWLFKDGKANYPLLTFWKIAPKGGIVSLNTCDAGPVRHENLKLKVARLGLARNLLTWLGAVGPKECWPGPSRESEI